MQSGNNMKSFLKFDENNVSRVIVRFSIILVFTIAIILFGIYTPKYYIEYKKNTESTKKHLEKLFIERIRFEVDEIVKNIEYRSVVQQKYLILTFQNENSALFKTIIEYFSENKTERTSKIDVFLKVLGKTDKSNPLKKFFIANSKYLLLNSPEGTRIINEDHTNTLRSSTNSALDSEEMSSEPSDSLFSALLGDGDDFISVNYSKTYDIYYGSVISKKYFKKIYKLNYFVIFVL